jgi:late competence protein required for DNA uptake (superfamily II DNA/RNA helicase)
MRPSSAFTSNVQEDKDAAQAALDADAEDGMDEAQWIGHIADLQAAHSSHVAGMVYARGIMDQAGTTAHRQRMFRVSSTDWHRFLGFASADQPVDELGKRKRSPWEDEAEESRVYRRHRLNTMDMTSALQQMTGQATIQFRGVQAPALRAIQDGESPVVAVMPTGGGKSMLFMLPAFAEPSGTTIVVVPLLALRSDMIRRCQALGISCVAWESRRPPDEATIVLVTPESAVTDDFHTFINRLQQTRRLDRIVIDECHVVLNNQRDFRPQLRQLGRLNHARTQMVLLTATLPPQLESTLLQRMQYPREQVSMFRARTSRPNVAYRVWQPFGVRASRDWFTAEPVTAFIQQRIQQAEPGKVIIYANVVRQVVDMARIIGCEAFHSQQIDKPSILERFTQGHTRVIAATSALGMGVDIPDIRCIIHLGAPRCLLDYAQESGRAGRDGQTSEAIIIQPEGPLRWPQDASPGDTELVTEYMEVVPGVGCRRYVLDEYLDGTVDGYRRQRCQDENPEEVPCDGCHPGWHEVSIVQPKSSTADPYTIVEPPQSPSPEHSMSSPSAYSNSANRHPQTIDIDHPSSSMAEPHGINEPPQSPATQYIMSSPSHATSSQDPPMDDPRSMDIDHPSSSMVDPRRVNQPQQSPDTQYIMSSPSHVTPSQDPPMDHPSSPHPSEAAFQSQPPRIDVAEQQRQRIHIQRQAAVDIQQRARDAQQWLDEELIESQAPQWQRQCYICTIQGHAWNEHDLYSCRGPASQVAKQWMLEIRRKIRYARFTACFRCGMPQSICSGWQVGGGTTCAYRDVLIPMTAAMVYGPWAERVQPLWARRLQAFGVDWQDIELVGAFLGQATVGVQGQHNQLFTLFCWLRRICMELEQPSIPN